MKYFKNTLFILVLFSSSLLFSQKDKVNSPDLLVVKFHADWCGSCIAMVPAFEDVQTKFDNENISFVKLDFTDSITQVKQIKLGIVWVYNQYYLKIIENRICIDY